MKGLSASTVAELSAAEVARALTRAFEGYLLGPVNMSAQTYERRFRAEDLDPFASRVYRKDGTPVGILLVARRGWTGRIAGLGVVPEMRGKGLGRSIMTGALEEAEARGDRGVVLEVFEQNAPAVKLYEGLGFRVKRRLIGFRRKPRGASSEAFGKLVELDPLEVGRIVAREGDPDLPWMLAAETISSATPPARAYHLEGHACVTVENHKAEPLVLTTLVVRRAERREGWGSRLLHALQAGFPGRTLLIPAVLPEGPAGALLAASGWEQEPLNQLEMNLEFPRSA